MSFDLQPILTGTLVHLRPLREEDWNDLFRVASDKLIWEQHPEPDRYSEKVFRRFFREAIESRGALIALKSRSGRVIGSSRFHGYDAEKSQVEIGWTFLARDCWGGAYNREMKELMLEHAFKFVRRVNFVVGTENFRSQHALEKIGARLIGNILDEAGQERLLFQIQRAE